MLSQDAAGRKVAMQASRGKLATGAMVRGINACFLDVLVTDWSVWPLYLGAAFAFVPPRMRAATTAVVNACWGVYISLMTARAAAPL